MFNLRVRSLHSQLYSIGSIHVYIRQFTPNRTFCEFFLRLMFSPVVVVPELVPKFMELYSTNPDQFSVHHDRRGA